MRTIRAAVIGAGFIGPAHIEALRRIGGVEVIGIASRDGEKARAQAARFGLSRVYRTWQEVVADGDVEVIHTCTPNNLHYEINKAAVLAGKHVVSEKPLTRTSAESEELVRLAKEKGVVHAVNFNYRFYPLIQHARALVQQGAIGTPYLVHGHYLQDWLLYDTDYNWRLESAVSGASRAMADIGSHWCDLIQFIVGSKIAGVFADLVTVFPQRRKPGTAVETFKGKETKAADSQPFPIDTEDAGVFLFRLDNGARGACTVSQVSAGRKNREWFEIDGSKQALAWDQEEPNQLWVGSRDKPNQLIIKDPSLLDDSARRYAHYPGGHPEGYPDGPKNLFLNVYEFIRAGKDPRREVPDFPTFEDGHRAIRIVEAILQSHRKQQWIAVGG